jgi:hypothetical protein
VCVCVCVCVCTLQKGLVYHLYAKEVARVPVFLYLETLSAAGP